MVPGGGDGRAAPTGLKPGALTDLLRQVAATPEQPEADPPPLPPGTVMGRFEIRREVGRGGFGAVYQAFDTELNRVVAVKTLRLGRSPQDLSSEWLRREAEAVARLDHPCIVTLFDVGTGPSGPCLVAELSRGPRLPSVRNGGVSPLAGAGVAGGPRRRLRTPPPAPRPRR